MYWSTSLQTDMSAFYSVNNKKLFVFPQSRMGELKLEVIISELTHWHLFISGPRQQLCCEAVVLFHISSSAVCSWETLFSQTQSVISCIVVLFSAQLKSDANIYCKKCKFWNLQFVDQVLLSKWYDATLCIKFGWTLDGSGGVCGQTEISVFYSKLQQISCFYYFPQYASRLHDTF